MKNRNRLTSVVKLIAHYHVLGVKRHILQARRYITVLKVRVLLA